MSKYDHARIRQSTYLVCPRCEERHALVDMGYHNVRCDQLHAKRIIGNAIVGEIMPDGVIETYANEYMRIIEGDDFDVPFSGKALVVTFRREVASADEGTSCYVWRRVS